MAKTGRPVVNTLSSKCHPEVPSYARGVCRACYNNAYREKNLEKTKSNQRAWQLANKEKVNAQKLAWAKANPEKVKDTKKAYVSRNLPLYRAQCAKRHASKMNRTPKWSDLKAIKEIYLNCPEGMEVDHIVPMQGENVSGLHVPYNLQYLTPGQNRSKGNRI